MPVRRFIAPLLILLLWSLAPAAQAQDSSEAVRMSIETAYGNAYRPEHWFPLRIQVRNDGQDFNGRLVVRPETSGLAVSNTYSTPIDLPTGSEKVAFLYIRARRAAQLTVELIDDEGVRVAQRIVGLNPIDPYDALHLLLADSAAPTINYSDVAAGGYDAVQARWEIANLPPDAGVLLALDTITIYQADTEALTVGQREALAEYVSLGGHLVVVGGLDWQRTASGLAELLPFEPDGSETTDDFGALAAVAGLPQASLQQGTARIAAGTPASDSRVFAENAEGLPLIVRREFGAGTVDYLTFDPTLEPIASWAGLPDLWYALFTTTPPQPGWSRGFLELQEAARAIAILPGVNLLPPILSMVAFVAAYILLIGPVNYFVLSRINRTGWAWFTIPLFIVIFTALAFTVGFNLRGNDVIVSHLRVVQADSETGIAREEQLLGVLSPRREAYTLGVPQGQFFTVLAGFQQSGVLAQGIQQSGVNVVQGANFSAENVVIDGGIFANFSSFAVVEAPAISGSATITYEGDEGRQRLRGVVRNDSEVTLEDAVILARNRVYRLDAPFAPGDVLDFDTSDLERITVDPGEQLPVASSFESAPLLDLGPGGATRLPLSASLRTTRVFLGERVDYTCRVDDLDEREDSAEFARRSAFVCSFMRDEFRTTSIGHEVYLMGWAQDALPSGLELEGIAYRSVDTGLYIVRLDTTVEQPPATQTVTLEADQFTWTLVERDVVNVLGGLTEITLVSPASAVARVMPLPGAVLDEVETMTITLDRSSSYGRDMELSLWDWAAQEWVLLEPIATESYLIEDAGRFLGFDNRVQMQLVLNRPFAGSAPTARIRDIRVTQTGNF